MATETSATGRESDKFMLRLPDGMRDRLSAAAKVAGRSMNAEIVTRLQRTFTDDVVGAMFAPSGLGEGQPSSRIALALQRMHTTDEELHELAPVIRPALRSQVEAASKEAGRSMNAEIVHRLQQSFEGPTLATEDAKFIIAKWKSDLAEARVKEATLMGELHHLAGIAKAMYAGFKGDEKISAEELQEWGALAAHIYDKTRVGDPDGPTAIRRLHDAREVVLALLHEPGAADVDAEALSLARSTVSRFASIRALSGAPAASASVDPTAVSPKPSKRRAPAKRR